LIVLMASLVAASAGASVLFLPAYPDRVLVVDEGTPQVVDTIQTQVGLPTGVRLSYDRKKIYITTDDNNGVAVIELATHKLLNHFTLNTSKTQFRFNLIAPDPASSGGISTVRLIFCVSRSITAYFGSRFRSGPSVSSPLSSRCRATYLLDPIRGI